MSEQDLARHYQRIYVERMRGLPIVNANLAVEAVGFRDFDAHRLGVLITPWFMNLILLPARDDWEDKAQGAVVDLELPREPHQLMVCRDDDIGVYLSAILFRTVADFPDQGTARAVALEIVAQLFAPAVADADVEQTPVSRRQLLTRLAAR